MKNNLLIKLSFIIVFFISVFLIISGIIDNGSNSIIYEEGINLSTVSIDLEVNESKMIEASVVPINATYKNLTWTSINPTIATVDNGNVTGISPGNSMIKVETEKMKIVRVITVNVHPKVIPVEQIIIENPNVEIFVGDTLKINYNILPEDATNKNLSFKSENPNVVAFNENYELVGVSEGNTVINISSDNSITEHVNVTVKKKIIDVTKIELNKKGLVLKVNKTEKVNAEVTPSNATDKTITWTSSNPSVATVDNGTIKAISYGDSIISAKSNNSIEATIKVVVPREYNPENPAVSAYFADSNRDIKNHFINNDCKSGNCDRPRGYASKISGTIKVSLYNATTTKKEYLKTLNDKYELTDLMIPGNIYYLESSKDSNQYEYVRVQKGLRMLAVSATRNVRDFGGWKTDTGTLKYGLIYRGAEPYTTAGYTEDIFKLIGITDIVDLRSNSDFNANKKYLTSFDKYNYAAAGYSINNRNNRLAVETIMKLVASGKSVFFHCAVGTDRTGTIAMLLEGILGVNTTSIFDDYELSYFYRQIANSGKLRTNGSFVSIYNKLKSYGNSEPEMFINWFLSGSKDKNEDLKLINNFRKKMIDGNPGTYKLSGGTVVKG